MWGRVGLRVKGLGLDFNVKLFAVSGPGFWTASSGCRVYGLSAGFAA